MWASIALTAAAFFMVMSLYLLGEQKKDETKWLKEVGKQLGYFGGDVAAAVVLSRQSQCGDGWAWRIHQGFPSGDWPLTEIYWHREDCISMAYKSSEDVALRVSPWIFLKLFSLTISGDKRVHQCTCGLGWEQEVNMGLSEK